MIDSSAVSSSAAVNPRDSDSEMLMDLTESTVSVSPRDSDSEMLLTESTVSVNPRVSDGAIDRNSF